MTPLKQPATLASAIALPEVSLLRPAARLGLRARNDPGVAIAALALAVGAVYVWVVSPGLPADEPSHWSTVLYYVYHERMPVLGDPGVSYEAQMGPVAYVLDGTLVRASRGIGLSLALSFRLVRLLGVVELSAMVLVVLALTKRLVPTSSSLFAAVAVFALNPMLLCMSGSIQNDTLALLLSVLALYMAVLCLSDRPTNGAAILVGVVAGLAVLTKLTAWAVVLAIPAWLIWRHRRRGLGPVLAFLGSALLVSGWWFVRNMVLYGDPTAAAGVRKTGVSFAPYHVHGANGLAHIAEEMVTYLWLPTEYVRNLISAPSVLKAALLGATIVVGLAGIGSARRLSGLSPLVVGSGVVSVVSWLVTYLGVQAVAFRVAYVVLPLWVCLMALALARLPARAGIALTGLVVIGINAWTLYELSRVVAPVFISLSSG